MPFLASSLPKRLVLGLASGLVFVGATGTFFWAISSGKVRPACRQTTQVGRLDGSSSTGPDQSNHSIRSAAAAGPGTLALPGADTSNRATTPGSRTGSSSHSGATRVHEDREGNDESALDESALFAALEQLERQMSAGMMRARDSVVALEYTAREGPPGSRRLATGVVINSRGDVLSVRIDPPSASSSSSPGPSSTSGGATRPTTIVAHDASGKHHLAHWVAADPETGLTLLQIAPRAVRPIQITAEEPTLGSQVFVVGNPFGLGHSVSRGQIAGLDRALKLGSRQLGGLIQVQAPLYPGDSGAVVANLRGQLLGLIRSGLAIPAKAKDRTERDNDFGFALPVRGVLWIADQLRAHGHVDRAYLGVRLEPVAAATPRPQPESGSPPDRDSDALPEGAPLLEVMAGTPAALAGLRAGDTIVAIDGQPVRSPHDLADRLDRLSAQSLIHLDVVRSRGPQRQRMTLALRTSSRTEDGAQAGLPPAPGSSFGQAAPSKVAQADPVTALAGPDSTPSSSASSSPVVPSAAPATSPSAVASGAEPAEPPPNPAAPIAPSSPEARIDQAETQSGREAPAAVSIPGPVRSPLPAAGPPPQSEDLKLTLPHAVADRLEQLERRLEKLERPPTPTSSQESRQASSARSP